MGERAVVIANPAASGFTGDGFRLACSILAERFEIEPHWPESPEGTHRLSLAAASEGAEAVIAMGGDGVVHHAAQGIIGSDTSLGIIPAGTTNVLGQVVGNPRGLRAAARGLLTATPRPMPSVRAELRHETGGLTVDNALFAFGVGFDADVVERAEHTGHRKRSLGGLHYALSTFRELRGYSGRAPRARVTVDDTTLEGCAAQAQIHPVYTYFGRIPIHIGPAPSGAMTVATHDGLTLSAAPALARGAFAGERMADRQATSVFTDVAAFDIQSVATPIRAQADGEPLGEIVAAQATFVADAYTVLA